MDAVTSRSLKRKFEEVDAGSPISTSKDSDDEISNSDSADSCDSINAPTTTELIPTSILKRQKLLRQKNVRFDQVTVYYFSRRQGFTSVPSQGGSSLGMAQHHNSVRKYTLCEFAQEQEVTHREILREHLKEEKLHTRKMKVPQRDPDEGVDVDLLITSIQERALLWDSRDPRHADQVVLRRLWNQVARSLWDGFDSAAARVQEQFLKKLRTRWRSMKDRFNRCLRKEEDQARSGAGAARTSTYKHYRMLSFLRPVLARRATHSSTLESGRSSGAVLHEAPPNPSQPSHSDSRPAPPSGEPSAGPSGVPLAEASGAPYLGYSRQRQRASDRPAMPEYLHLGTVFQNCFKALGDQMSTGLATIDWRLNSMESELSRPAKHFFSAIEKGMVEYLTPELQISVMQACNNAYVSALQQARVMQAASTMPVVPTLSRMTPSPAAQHSTSATRSTAAITHYTSPGAEGRRHRQEPPSSAPARTSARQHHHQDQEGERTTRRRRRVSSSAPAAPTPEASTMSGSSRSRRRRFARLVVPPPSPPEVVMSPPSGTVLPGIPSTILDYGSSSSSRTPPRTYQSPFVADVHTP